MFSGFELWPMEEGRQYSEYSVESNPRAYMSMRDYRNQLMGTPSYSVTPTYAPPPHPQYASWSQPQPPQPISPIEQAILDLTKLVGDAVVEQKEFNAQLSEKIHTEENSLDQRLDGLNNDFEHEWDNLQDSIEDLIDLRPCPPEEGCQSGTMVEEPCLQQPQESLVKNFESSVGTAICLWEKKEATFPLTKKSSGHETGEEPQEPILQPIPMKLNPSVTAQPQNNPLPVAPSDNQVYILPSPAPKSTHAAPAPNHKSNLSLHVMQKFKKLVANVQAFATTSKTQAVAYIAWHSGLFECRFGFGAPESRHF